MPRIRMKTAGEDMDPHEWYGPEKTSGEFLHFFNGAIGNDPVDLPASEQFDSMRQEALCYRE